MQDDHNQSPEISGMRANLNLTGNEPMLKGVYNKAQADKHGAYLAWNPKALIEMMNADQHARFNVWCIRVALRKAYRVLPLFEVLYPDDKRPRQALEAAQSWHDHPVSTPESINGLAVPYFEATTAVHDAHEAERQHKDMASAKAESAALAALNTVRAAHSSACGTTLRTTELLRQVGTSSCTAEFDDILVEWKPTWTTMKIQRRSMRRAIRRAAYMIVLRGY